MKRFLPLVLCLTLPASAFPAGNTYRVIYDGGSVDGLKIGRKTQLSISGSDIRLLRDKNEAIIIPASAITEVTYHEDAHRRVGEAAALALFSPAAGVIVLFTKSKKHYIGITWANGPDKGGFIMECEKAECGGMLTGLEGITGKKAVDSDPAPVKK